VFSSTEPLLVFLDEALDLDRLGDARRGDAQKLHVAVVVALRIEAEIDAQRTNRAPIDQDRHADEAQFFLGKFRTLGRAIEERRLLAHARDDDRAPAFGDFADNPLADAIAHGVRRRVEPVGGLDVQLAVVVSSVMRLRTVP
jgi:hypothetical protein